MSRTEPATAAPRGSAVRRFLGRIGVSEYLVLALTIVIGVWSWRAYVVDRPQDVDQFMTVYFIAVLSGAVLQTILAVYVQPGGSLRSRLTVQMDQSGSWVVYCLPPVAFLLTFLLSTPSSTRVDGFGGEGGLYRTIVLVFLMSVLATAMGSLLFMAVIIAPVTMLLRGLLPAGPSTTAPERGEMSRTEYLCGGLIIFCAVGFGVSMSLVGDNGATSSHERMGSQLIHLVTLRGRLVPAVLVVVCVLALVVLVIVANRAADRRRGAWLAALQHEAATETKPGKPRSRSQRR